MAKKSKTETKKVEQIEQKPKTKRKGRTAGIKLEKNEAIIYIDKMYRFNLSDGRNIAIEKFLTKTRMNDGEDENGNKWHKNDKYTEWTDINCYHKIGNYKRAFAELHDMMVLDGIKEKDTVTTKEFNEIYQKKLDWLEKLFKSDFTDK